MIWRQILAAFAFLLVPCAAAAAGIEDFFGTWQGVEVNVDGPGAIPKLAPADLDMSITGQDGGFRVRAFALGRGADGRLVPRPFDAAFAPTDTPGVFAYKPAAGSLLSSLFADPSVGNPLKGDTLLWARLQDAKLHVYSLAIDGGGGFALDHSTGQLTADGLVTRYVLRLSNDRIVTVEGRLERTGG
jgi:hypothetical protein